MKSSPNSTQNTLNTVKNLVMELSSSCLKLERAIWMSFSGLFVVRSLLLQRIIKASCLWSPNVQFRNHYNAGVDSALSSDTGPVLRKAFTFVGILNLTGNKQT